ncbi:glycoside hydrolase family 97 N-terminal domain-containing protein, partial [Maribacter dokdonensis]
MDKNKFLRLKFLVLIVIFSFNACTGQQTIFTVKAPEANVWVVLNASNGAIKYRFLKEGKELIGESEIAIIPNATALKVVGSSVNSKHETWKPVWGQFSEITDEYAELILEVLIEDVKAKLYVRVFNEGIGLRYELEEYKEDTEVDFYCEYNLNNKDVLYSP